MNPVWPEFDNGRAAFIGMLTATLHDDLWSASKIIAGLDQNELIAALSVAVGTAAANVREACAETGMTVDEYCVELGLAAAREAEL